jgi:hypothetical protein
MATNEIYKYGQWLSLPLPFKGLDPHVNNDPTRNGDPVYIGGLVGVAQEVGGVATTVTVGSATYGYTRNTADSLEPGWASVALCGAWAFSAAQQSTAIPQNTPIGTMIGITASNSSTPAKIQVGGAKVFGCLVGWTKDAVRRPIVNIIQTGTPAGPVGS